MAVKPRVLLLFVDGIGVGTANAHNPFFGAPIDMLAPLGGAVRGARSSMSNLVLREIDATLGYPGLPQSATGQAVLFTGDDAIAIDGGHREGYPTRALTKHLLERSFLRRAREAGLRATFLNAFEETRANKMERIVRGLEPRERRVRPSASAVTALAGDGKLCTLEDARKGRAATFDLTGDLFRAYGIDAPKRTIEEAADAVIEGWRENDIALFEMFLTDKAGHAQDITWARYEIVRVERFLRRIFDRVHTENELVIVTSDHGNLEDLSTRTHTRANVPLFVYGAGANDFVGPDNEGRSIETLRDIAPRILRRFH